MALLLQTSQPTDSQETKTVALIAVAIGVAIGLLFSVFPMLDIAVSGLFHTQDGFTLNEGFWRVLRTAFLRGYTVWYVVIIVAGIAAARMDKPVLGLDWLRWLYLGLCSLIGPLLLTNIILKEHWGRWRPREILELGGAEKFTSVLNPGGTCLDNCSFVSGEVSSMVMIFVALAFVTVRCRPVFWVLTVAMGLLSALLRVGQGGHFLSDTIFAGVFMVLVASAVYWAMFLSPYAGADDVRRRRMESELVARHDSFWASVCERGLRWLDAIAPRQ
mgnify:CR=1 FL=1